MRDFLLKIMTVFTLLSCTVPIILYGEMDSFNYISFYRCVCIYLPCLLLCYFLGGLIKAHIVKNSGLGALLVRIIRLLTALVLSTVPFAVFLLFGRFYSMAAALAICLIYFYSMGMWCRKKDYMSLSKPLLFAAQFGVSLFCYIGISIGHQNHRLSREIIIFNLLITILFVCVVSNQANITKLISRRPDTELFMPRNLRRRNALLIGAVCIAVVVCYGFRYQIGGVLVKIAYFLLWLLQFVAFLFKTPTRNGEAAAWPWQQAAHGRGYNWWDVASTIFLTLLAVFLVFRFRDNILQLIEDIIDYIIRLFTRKGKSRHAQKKEAAYIDYIEMTDKREEERQNSIAQDIKQYKKEKNPEIKLRLAYKIFARRLINAKIDIKSADTVRECIEKGARFYFDAESLERMKEYQKQYELVRYADAKADSYALRLADEIVNEVKRHRKF